MTESGEKFELTSDEALKKMSDFEKSADDLPPEALKRITGIEKKISDELLRSKKRFFFAYPAFSLFGYFVSLSLCSQNSIALTAFSLDTASLLHKLPDPLCPLVCGWFFSLVPVSFLFVFLDRFQVRRMLSELWWLPVATAFMFCVLMMLLPATFQHEGMHLSHAGLRHTQGDLIWLIWWTFGSVSIPVVFGWLGRRFISS